MPLGGGTGEPVRGEGASKGVAVVVSFFCLVLGWVVIVVVYGDG